MSLSLSTEATFVGWAQPTSRGNGGHSLPYDRASVMNQEHLDRRDFLWRFGGGLGGIALAHLLGQEGLLAGPGPTAAQRSALNGGLHHPAKAKRVVQLFMSGAASQ